MNDKTDPRPPHQWVADKIDFSIAGVSLLRNGMRLPSFTTMGLIEEEFGWSLARQIRARTRGAYSTEFEKVLEKKYAEETATK